MSSPVTGEGSMVGTFQYMAQEQIHGENADARTDIFALGAVLYEMVTGKRAFDGQNQISVMSAILEKEPEPISTLRPLAPPALDRVATTCMAKDREERLQTAHDLKLQLEWIRDAGSQAGLPAPVAARRRISDRVFWASAVILIAAISFFAGMYFRPANAPEVPIVSQISSPARGRGYLRDDWHLGRVRRTKIHPSKETDRGNKNYSGRPEDSIADPPARSDQCGQACLRARITNPFELQLQVMRGLESLLPILRHAGRSHAIERRRRQRPKRRDRLWLFFQDRAHHTDLVLAINGPL